LRAIFYLLLAALLAPGCKQYTPDNLPANHVRFGSKGGITGGGREYVLLLDNGRLLFDDEYTGKLEKVGKLTKAELAAVGAELAEMDFPKNDAAPGNYNTSMTYHHDGTTEKISWKQPGGAPTDELKTCYNSLMTAVRRLRKTDN